MRALAVFGIALTCIAHAQVVINPSPTFNGVQPNGLKLKIRSARPREPITLNARAVKERGKIRTFKFEFRCRKAEGGEAYRPEIGTTLFFDVKGVPQPQVRRIPHGADDNAFTPIPKSRKITFEVPIDEMVAALPTLERGKFYRVTIIYDDHHVNFEAGLRHSPHRSDVGIRDVGVFKFKVRPDGSYEVV